MRKNTKNMFAAVIQARLRSKRCHNKMLRTFAGTSLAGLAASKFSKRSNAFTFYFAARERELLGIAKKYNCRIIKRNKKSAHADDIRDVMNYLRDIKERYIIFINACSPFLKAGTVERAVRTFVKNGCRSLTAVVLRRTWYYDTKGHSVNVADPTILNTKATEPLYEVTHNIHIFDRRRFLKYGYFWENKPKDPYLFEISEEESLDIDTEFEFQLAESLYEKRFGRWSRSEYVTMKLKEIEMLIMDVDGVMTDGGMYYSKKGECAKKFNTRDGMGIRMARLKGIKMAVITGEESDIVKRRMQKLKIEHLFMGVSDKLKVLKTISAELGVPLKNMAYIGDDVNDIGAMRKVGLPIAVSDASDGVKEVSDYVTLAKGGRGAVREVCDMIMESKFGEEHVR